MKLQKALALSCALAAFAMAGCTAVQEVGDDVTEKFDEGITGQGRLVSPDPIADSFGSDYN